MQAYYDFFTEKLNKKENRTLNQNPLIIMDKKNEIVAIRIAATR